MSASFVSRVTVTALPHVGNSVLFTTLLSALPLTGNDKNNSLVDNLLKLLKLFKLGQQTSHYLWDSNTRWHWTHLNIIA